MIRSVAPRAAAGGSTDELDAEARAEIERPSGPPSPRRGQTRRSS